MESIAFPAWEFSVGEDGSDLETFCQEKTNQPTHAALTLPPEAGKGEEALMCICGAVKYHLRQLAVPWNIWLRPRCFAFIKSGYFPSAFHKNQHWSPTHRLKTACAGCRGQEFSGGTGWNCPQIGNRRLGDKGGEREGEGKAEQEIDAELMFSQDSEADRKSVV